MANERHIELVKKGYEVWNKWRVDNPDTIPDLLAAKLQSIDFSMYDFHKADLRYVDFSHSTFVRTNFSETDLSHADFIHAEISRTDLSNSILQYTDFSLVNLFYCNFNNSDLKYAKFLMTILTGCNFKNANADQVVFGFAIFADIDLSEIKGLETAYYPMPITVGIDSIIRTKGRIHENFLQAARVPKQLVEYVNSLTDVSPIQYYSCFISYSNEDIEIAEKLYSDLRSNGIQVWFFPKDAKWGEFLWREIEDGIKVYDKVIMLCSKNSLTSTAVLDEMEKALWKEASYLKQHEKEISFLLPVSLDDYIFNQWEHPAKSRILRKVVGNFSGCESDIEKYKISFNNLLSILQRK